MDRGRWITFLSGLLVLLLIRSGVADDSDGDVRIHSPRRLFTDPPLFPEPVFELPAVPADSAASAGDETVGLPENPPADEPETPAPPAEHGPSIPVPEISLDNESNWLNRVMDEHLLIWREFPGGLEFIPGGHGGFGLTTIGFKSAISSDSSPGAWLVPKFDWSFLSGPRSPDLPPQLYRLSLQFNFAIDMDANTRLHMQIAPTWATDFDAGAGESFRMIAGGLFTHDLSREWMLALGAVYLDRPDLPALPLGGVRWRPADNLELNLMFPQPRAAWRFDTEDSGTERWFFIGGGLGGGSWAFERAGGSSDRVGYLDLRILAGIERREPDGDRDIFEVGYIFDRRLDFATGPGDQNLPGTLVIRSGVVY